MLIAPGIIQTILGTGQKGWGGDGDPTTAAALTRPHRCGLDAAGNLSLTDTHNHRMRVVGL